MRRILIFVLAARAAMACASGFSGSPCTATVGTSSRNFSNLAACIAGIPANLVTDGNSYVCALYNDSEFTSSSAVTISGHTTDATHTITITAAAGQSFQDQGSVRANALKYNQANGVAINDSIDYGSLFYITDSYVTISRLQLTTNSTVGRIAINLNGQDHVNIVNNLIDTAGQGGTGSAPVHQAGANLIANNVIIQRSRGDGGISCYQNCILEANTIISPSNIGSSAPGLTTSYGASNVALSNAVFGFTGTPGGTWSGSGENATNAASGLPGSSNVYNVSYSASTPFYGAGSTTLDLRAISGTALIGAGYLDTSNAPTDISGYTRPASPTIGAWQVAACGTGSVTVCVTSGSSWSAQTDGCAITVQAIGGGGNGDAGSTGSDYAAGGGGGGAYAMASIGYMSGAAIPIQVGGIGADSIFNTALNTVVAKGGTSASGITAGSGGQDSACTPATGAYSGGGGGSGLAIAGSPTTGGAGGGSAGPNGAGAVGGIAAFYGYAYGGTGDANHVAGGNSGGGAGGSGTEWTSCGAGGGGGGGGGSGGPGGSYGGGGGGGGYNGVGGSAGNGQPGLLVITYTPATPVQTLKLAPIIIW